MGKTPLSSPSDIFVSVGKDLGISKEHVYALLEKGVQTDTDYVRPTGFFNKGINTWLGKLPEGFKKIDDVSASWMFLKRWHRVLGAVSAILIWFAMITLMVLFPWMIMSPFSIVANLIQGKSPTESSSIVAVISLTLVVIAVIASFVWAGRFRNWMTKTVLLEEMWFRAGSESWSYGRRLYSCIAFAFAHIFNLIYPIGVLIVLVLAGMLFMAVYLHIHKKTGDPYQAVLASARVHSAYNITSIYWVAGVVAGLNALQLFM